MSAFVLFLVVLGVVVLRRGLKGRDVDCPPYCAACRYDLRGGGSDPYHCPECGADLAGAGAVATTRRLRLRSWVVVGASVLGVAMLMLAGDIAMRVTGINWNRLKPTSMLKQTVSSGSWASSEDEAWLELQRRLQSGVLTRGDVDELIEVALQGHAASAGQMSDGSVRDSFVSSRSRSWQSFGSGAANGFLWLQTAYDTGAMTHERLAAHLGSMYEPAVTIKIRPSVRRGQAVPTSMELRTGKLAGLDDLQVAMAMDELKIDGRVVPQGDENEGFPAVFGLGQLEGTAQVQPYLLAIDLEPGEHEVTMRVKVGLTFASFGWSSPPFYPGNGAMAGSGRWPGTLREWTFERRSNVRVMPEDAAAVELLTAGTDAGADIASRVAKCLEAASVIVWEGRRNYTQHFYAGSDISTASPAPVDMAFDVIWRWGETDLRVGKLTVRRGQNIVESELGPIADAAAIPNELAVVLRPSVEQAERTVDMEKIWGEPIVFNAVAVKRKKDCTCQK